MRGWELKQTNECFWLMSSPTCKRIMRKSVVADLSIRFVIFMCCPIGFYDVEVSFRIFHVSRANVSFINFNKIVFARLKQRLDLYALPTSWRTHTHTYARTVLCLRFFCQGRQFFVMISFSTLNKLCVSQLSDAVVTATGLCSVPSNLCNWLESENLENLPRSLNVAAMSPVPHHLVPESIQIE